MLLVNWNTFKLNSQKEVIRRHRDGKKLMASDRMTQKVKVNIENKNFFLNIEKVTQQIKYAFTKAQAFIKKKNYFDCPLWF